MSDSMSKRNRERKKRQKKLEKTIKRARRDEIKEQNGGTLPTEEEPVSAADLFEELAQVGEEVVEDDDDEAQGQA